jgi:hypothetical protein
VTPYSEDVGNNLRAESMWHLLAATLDAISSVLLSCNWQGRCGRSRRRGAPDRSIDVASNAWRESRLPNDEPPDDGEEMTDGKLNGRTSSRTYHE